MNMLLLPGNSPSNKPWAMEVAAKMGDEFDKVIVHNYLHWETGEGIIDIEEELEKAAAKASSLNPYIILAKSVGIVLALRGINERAFKPSGCIFLGFPIGLASREGVPAKGWLQTLNIPTWIVQNDQDPAGKFSDLEQYLRGNTNPNVRLMSLPGSSHRYDDLGTLKNLMHQLRAN